jgi:hypothetical protein
LNQVLVTRNPSVTSSQLNAAAPLVRITRVPSNKSTISDVYRGLDTNVTVRKPVKPSKAESTNVFRNLKARLGPKLYPFVDVNVENEQPGLKRTETTSSGRSKPSSTHSSGRSTSSKSTFHLSKPTREAPVPPTSSGDNVTLRSDRNKENKIFRSSKPPPGYDPEVVTIRSTDRNKENKNVRPNTLALNSPNQPPTRRYITQQQQQQQQQQQSFRPVPAARRQPQTFLESLTKRR